MNRKQINDFRKALGLQPVELTIEQAEASRRRKRAQDANRAAHAQLQRDIKAARSKGGKAR